MGKKTTTYKVEPDENFIAFAVSSAEDDYRLAWLLNTTLDITLGRTESTEQDEERLFPTFFYEDVSCKQHYTLAANRTKTGQYLIPQLKNVDYIFKISGTLTDERQTQLINALRIIPEISACIPIQTDSSAILFFLKKL